VPSIRHWVRGVGLLPGEAHMAYPAALIDPINDELLLAELRASGPLDLDRAASGRGYGELVVLVVTGGIGGQVAWGRRADGVS